MLVNPMTSNNPDIKTVRVVLYFCITKVHNKRKTPSFLGALHKSRQCPTLPRGCPPSTIGANGLNFRVRNGNGCIPIAITTANQLLKNSIASAQAQYSAQALDLLVSVSYIHYCTYTSDLSTSCSIRSLNRLTR